MEYKGYIGQVAFDEEASIFHGRVINTRDVISFYGKSVSELRKAFRESVDVYLDFCAERGEEPDKPFSGQFVARVSPELHRQASYAAQVAGKSLNSWVAETLQSALNTGSVAPTGKRQRKNARVNGLTSSARSGKKTR